MDIDPFLVHPGKDFRLKDFDPEDTSLFKGGKEEGKQKVKELTEQLGELQELLYAENKHGFLIVLQGMDTSGKDSTIRQVFQAVNPQGVRVATFKAPTEIELQHDYLWRVHQKVPARGEMVIFNRSHYEDVLIVRVHDLVPKGVWKKRYDHINAFEKMLTDEGTIVLKFFLYISKDEQKERLLDRLNKPHKTWKFNPEDIEEREKWAQYVEVYEEALQKTSTEYAPWYVVPANHKWFRNIIIATALVKKLKNLDPAPPEAIEDVEDYKEVLEGQP